MALIHSGSERMTGIELPEAATLGMVRQTLEDSRESLAGLPDLSGDINTERITTFLGSIGLEQTNLIVTDTTTRNAQTTLIHAGVFDFSTASEVSGAAHLFPNAAIVHRTPGVDTQRAIEQTAIHELMHLNGLVRINTDNRGGNLQMPNTTGLREKDGDQIHSTWEEAWAQLAAAAYDGLANPEEQYATARTNNLEVPTRYIDHPSRPCKTVVSGIAAVGLELLVHRDPYLMQVLAETPHARSAKYALRRRIDRLAPDVDSLYDRVNKFPATEAGYSQGLNLITKEVYKDERMLPSAQQIGAVSLRFFERQIKVATDSSLYGRARRWVFRTFA